MDDNSKTVYRYDSGGKGFRKVAFLLMGLAGVLAIFVIFWVRSWF